MSDSTHPAGFRAQLVVPVAQPTRYPLCQPHYTQKMLPCFYRVPQRIAVPLCLVPVLLLGWVGWVTSPNKTEVGHLGAAAYFGNMLRFDVFHVNPPLTRMVTSLPVLMCNPNYNWGCYSSRPQDRSEWLLGEAFIKANSSKKIRWCLALARWLLVPLLLFGAYCGYLLSREMYGESAGLLFLGLYLKEWLDSHPDVKLDGLAYWGSYSATLAGIRETLMPPANGENEQHNLCEGGQIGPRSGWYALSVNYIYGRDRWYRYFLHFEPVAMAGYSIYIYHITLPEANRVRRELGLVELKDEGDSG